MNYYYYLISYFSSIPVFKTKSEINSCLEVSYINGHLLLNTENANYSFGSLYRAFKKLFKKINLKESKIENVLILGFGAGSIASLLYDEYKINCNIIGVEKDEKIINIAKKYFKTDKYKKLKILNADAYDYVLNSTEVFDLIIFDVYIDNIIPEKFETEFFLKNIDKLMTDNSMFVFNKFVFDNNTESSAIFLSKKFKKVFKKSYELKIKNKKYNLMLIYKK